jgi:hypothetical protein
VTGWERGRDQILGMLERRELTRVTANTQLADRLPATARQHVESTRLLTDSDPYLAYAAVQAQFGASMSTILRPIDRIRVTRHEAEYPGPTTYIDKDAVLEDLPKAEAVIEAVALALPHLPVFTE